MIDVLEIVGYCCLGVIAIGSTLVLSGGHTNHWRGP